MRGFMAAYRMQTTVILIADPVADPASSPNVSGLSIKRHLMENITR
jgi:hypothetical protein